MSLIELNPGDDIASITASVSPGTEIVLHAGTYSLPTGITWTGTGTEDAPIVVHDAGDGEVILELEDGWQAIDLEDASFWEIRGISIRGGESNQNGYRGIIVGDGTNITLADLDLGPIVGNAIELDGNNSGVTISHVHIHDVSAGRAIGAGCWDASCWTEASTIEDSWIHDIGTDYDGIRLEAGCQGVTMRDNVVYRTGDHGIIVNSTEFGDANVIEGNAIWDTIDSGIDVRGTALVRNNVIARAGTSGINLADDDHSTLQDVVVSFNTIVDPVEWGVEVYGWAGKTGMVFANNVIASPLGYGLTFDSVDDGLLIADNVVTGLVQGLDDYTAATPVIAGGGYRDFMDAEAMDYYPASAGVMVNAADPDGSTWVPDTDFNGAPREGDTPDAGAYERDGGDNPGWPLQEGYKELDYTPPGDDVIGGCCAKKDNPDAAEAATWGLAAAGWLIRRKRRSPAR